MTSRGEGAHGATHEQHYRSSVVPLDWKLSELEPKVAIAQLRAQYRAPSIGDSRILHVEDSEYDDRLFAALEKATELRATFVVFPEYAWPLRLAERVLQLARRKMLEGTAWLLPFEHLRHAEFVSLVAQMPVPRHLRDEILADIELGLSQIDRTKAYVNVCFSLLRSASSLIAVPQTKIRGAGLEERDLVGGRHIYVVKGDDCTFAVSICFDMIARDESHSERPRGAVIPRGATLEFVFVPECNPSPLHHSYARAVIDLCEEPALAPSLPYFVFANVAGKSLLPSLTSSPSFGFSSIVGRLGRVSTSGNAAVVHAGVVAAEKALSLKDLAKPAHQMPLPTVQWLVARPQESLFLAALPRVRTGPSPDPAVRRANTSFDAFRWVAGWQRVRASVGVLQRKEHLGVPQGLLVDQGLVGASRVDADFRQVLATAPTPLWIYGQGGVGKTALTASILRSIEETGTASVLWIDLSEVASSDADLREHVLLKLGLNAGLRADATTQWQLIREHLGKKPTVLVLDSRELWGLESLPSELLALHGWPSRIVVTARNQPDPDAATFTTFEVPPLDLDSAVELIRRQAPRNIDAGIVGALAAFALGSPLACTWIGGALAAQAANLVNAVQRAETGEASALEVVFEETTRGLSAFETEVLLVLSWLPHPVSERELADICGSTVRAAVNELRARHLIIVTEGELEGIHAAHPFVRQFVARLPRQQDPTKICGWAERRLSELGGDKNWKRYPHLAVVWPNICAVMDSLAKDAPADFLRLWRLADYFLWSSGQRRERERLGSIAAEIARALHEPAHLVHALYDSVAECRWHGSGSEQECRALLDEAESVARGMEAPGPHMAMIEHYRSRMYRHFGRLDEAMAAAERAAAQAVEQDDEGVIGLCTNALGNVFRARHEFGAALAHFEKAAECFDKASDLEMKAIALRNQGRCHVQMDANRRAIEEFQESMDLLRDLHLEVECAEVALDHARALADLGEHEEAEAEAAEARMVFANLGALERLRDADELLSSVRRRAQGVF